MDLNLNGTGKESYTLTSQPYKKSDGGFQLHTGHRDNVQPTQG